MKIGILTFHRALNYGALLQAYALQENLIKNGADTHIIDYRCLVIENAYTFPTLLQCRSLKSFAKYFLQGKYELKRRNKFDSFREKQLHMSEESYNSSNISVSADIYDRFVSGSDQVWNCFAHNFDKNYFLNFCKDEQKYSYAASIGISELPKEFFDDYKALLSKFQVCSVRENQGLSILNSLDIENKRMDLDPTFLLSKDEWLSRLNVRQSNEKYIFAYYFELTPTLKRFIEELTKKTGLEVRFVGCPLKKPFTCKCKALKTADPIDFVSAMANAAYVVTNSFHGTAFSINFNKMFFVELLKTDNKVNSRLTNILEATSLEHRTIDSFDSIDTAICDSIEWNDVNERIGKMKSDSEVYIRRIVNEN